jgi:hypothetical protein
MDAMADAIWAGGAAMSYWAANIWLAWPVGGVLGAITGFTGGVWLDEFIKKREKPPTLAAKSAVIGRMDGIPAPQFVPLPQVASRLYGSLDKCHLRDFVDKNRKTTLDALSGVIAKYCSLWGVRLPSNVINVIDKSELFTLKIRGDKLYEDHEYDGRFLPTAIYATLCIAHKDINKTIDAIMADRNNIESINQTNLSPQPLAPLGTRERK